MTIIGNDISAAARLLLDGKLVAIPTETVYGLAANALNPDAVRQIFDVKRRPATNPLIVHLASVAQLSDYVATMPHTAWQLITAFCPGPLTLVLPRTYIVPDIITGGRDTVAVRFPKHPLTRALLRETGVGLAAPSANPYGYISPTTAHHVNRMLGNHIPYILDGGPCTYGIESTIIGFPNDKPTIYRAGSITRRQIEQVIGTVYQYEGHEVHSPGMMAGHYSPSTPLYITADIQAAAASYAAHGDTGIICHSAYVPNIPQQHQIVLSHTAHLPTAAKKLYAALHDMDTRGYKRILIEQLPADGVGEALNDRLKRAATPHIASFSNNQPL
jgi:L-threonylcarbamoyladenylate synthase